MTSCWRCVRALAGAIIAQAARSPPYGDVDDRVRYIAMLLGMSTIMWDTVSEQAERACR
jgi:hypothetical protein